ncbi:unnamed protein product [Cuscuta campestris]|uniref:Nucleotide-diphospho-sugar transferase domain-containing protein n=1 Tax=Cuscuta campestris TaxID=132261 RepID=A0A484MFW1_9ASTE|nr:unnamed protein product [Cuscuta campestris]
MQANALLGTSSLDKGNPKVTIFTAPRPFHGVVGERQELAVRSWLGLSPDIAVVLFTQHPSASSFAMSFGSKVAVQPDIDFSFLGTPYFHSMMAYSEASQSDISVLIHPESILLPDFISTITHAHKLDHEWLLFALSRNISNFPFRLDEDGKQWLTDDGTHVNIEKMQRFLSKEQNWSLCQEQILIAWNNADIPLHNGILPPFLYGKGFHNLWVINEAFRSDFRFVFDASNAISSLYLHQPDLEHKKLSADRTWEFMGNFILATSYGSLYFHDTKHSNFFGLFECEGKYFFLNTAEKIAIHLSSKEQKLFTCIVTSLGSAEEGSKHFPLPDNLNRAIPISLRVLTLESLLSLCADKKNKTIVLAVVGYNYKDMLMSWACRMRHLKVSNFLVCALDNEVYDFSILQGLPVFKYSSTETKISYDDCHFGTECFKRVTKMKSRMVLKILKMGYNVLMSDVDIYWFKNPLPFLSSFGPAVLVAQSDEYNLTGAINLPGRLNSGFYYAHSDNATIVAFQKVVIHATASTLSEQPSFYDTLCGAGGSNRVGEDGCLEPTTKLRVHFLDRDHFPNGGLWEEVGNAKEACEIKGCFVLHNNWVSGRRKKMERQDGLVGCLSEGMGGGLRVCRGRHCLRAPGNFLMGSVVFQGQCKSNAVTFQINGVLVAPSDFNVVGRDGTWIEFIGVSGVSLVGGTLDGRAPEDSPNTDGIHVQSSSNVKISRSVIGTGDDCISIGPGSSNLSRARAWNQVKLPTFIGSLGWEMQEEGVENVVVSGASFFGTQNGFRIKTWSKPSNGFARNITFEHGIMSNVKNPIIIDQNYCPNSNGCPNKGSGVKISDISYQDIHGTSATEVGIQLNCSSKESCEDITLNNVNLGYQDGAAQMSCANNAHVTLLNSLVKPSSSGCLINAIKGFWRP